MTYDQLISDIVKVVEAIGAAVMIIGGLLAFVDCASRHCVPDHARALTDNFAADSVK